MKLLPLALLLACSMATDKAKDKWERKGCGR